MKKLSDKTVDEVLEAARKAGDMFFAAETGVYRNGRLEHILIPAQLIAQLALEVQKSRQEHAAEMKQIRRQLGISDKKA